MRFGPVHLKNWTQYGLFHDWETAIQEVAKLTPKNQSDEHASHYQTPAFYSGNFILQGRGSPIHDTFLRLDGWSKGIAWLNGFCLGRYWPNMGPQVTLYVPGVLFRPYPTINQLILLEQERAPCSRDGSCKVKFVKHHEIHGKTPFNNHWKGDIIN